MYTVLVAGASPEWLKIAAAKGYLLGAHDPTKIKESADQMLADMKLFKNTTFERHFLNPDDPDNWERFVALLKSRKWDVISYGGGVRQIPQLTDFFTNMIHLAMREQHQAIMLFPLLPEQVVPALRKHFPHAD